MIYKELNRRTQNTVITTVEFTFEDGATKEVDISHFMPETEDDILLGISNRYITEERAYLENKESLLS